MKSQLTLAILSTHPYKDNILNEEQARIIATPSFDHGPGEYISELQIDADRKMYEELVQILIGMTYYQAAQELWADEPLHQLGYIISSLHTDEFEEYEEEH